MIGRCRRCGTMTPIPPGESVSTVECLACKPRNKMLSELECLRDLAVKAARYLAVERGVSGFDEGFVETEALDAARRQLLNALDHHDQNFKKKREG